MANGSEGFSTKPVGVEELSESELKFGYWFVTHKEPLRKALIIFLIGFSVLTYGYALFATGRYFLFWYEDYQQALLTAGTDYINVVGVHQANQIQDIQILGRDIFNLGEGKIDLVARVRNPNPQWALESFTYQFAVGGALYEARQSFLLPGEEKYVLLLNVEGRVTGSPQVLISDRQWQRVTKYEDWGPQRLNFVTSDKTFLSPRQGEISGQLPVSEVRATVTNSTPYNYIEVEAQVGLFAGSRLVAVTTIPIRDFASGQTRQISSRWTQSLPPVSQVEMIYTVNSIDESVFRGFEGEFDPSLIEFDERGRRL